MGSVGLLRILVVTCAVIAVALTANIKTEFEEEYVGLFGLTGKVYLSYNCTGKENGNYPHPSNCYHYIACTSAGQANDMPCAANCVFDPCSAGPPRESQCTFPTPELLENCQVCQ